MWPALEVVNGQDIFGAKCQTNREGCKIGGSVFIQKLSNIYANKLNVVILLYLQVVEWQATFFQFA